MRVNAIYLIEHDRLDIIAKHVGKVFDNDTLTTALRKSHGRSNVDHAEKSFTVIHIFHHCMSRKRPSKDFNMQAIAHND